MAKHRIYFHSFNLCYRSTTMRKTNFQIEQTTISHTAMLKHHIFLELDISHTHFFYNVALCLHFQYYTTKKSLCKAKINKQIFIHFLLFCTRDADISLFLVFFFHVKTHCHSNTVNHIPRNSNFITLSPTHVDKWGPLYFAYNPTNFWHCGTHATKR